MSFSATRLTCFALVSGIEDDMRSLIADALGDADIANAVPQDRAERAQLRRAKDGLPPATALPGILAYLDFSDSWEILMTHAKALREVTRESLNSIKTALQRIIEIRNRVAHTRPMEIDDSAALLDVASDLIANSPGDWLTLTNTLEKLRYDPSFVLGLTVDLPHDPDPAPQHNLPIPDFDETGFFGRRDQLRRIKRAIKGAYPVVSVLGEGGIGKTSIALKAAYELLEDPKQPFDAYVWVTAKATVLTTNEIRRISGAIESSLGLFTEALTQLVQDPTEDPVEELLSYLESFKILLILDNMETVLDDRLRNFLLDLPLGSKVLITSRIGLGIENPVQLEPLTLDDSVRLIRTLSRIRDVSLIKSLPQESIESIAEQMGGHPTYMKWFVAGVQAGRRPEELLGDKALLLEFCMSNVYDHLSQNARSLIDVMQVNPGLRNQAELAYLNDSNARDVQSSLLELITTNFVQMTSQMTGHALDTAYHLSDFATEYLNYHHPVDETVRNLLLSRRRELADLGSTLAAESSGNPYSRDAVYVRASGDIHVAKILRDALMGVAHDPASSLSQCLEVQLLAPTYYEGWRVEGNIRVLMRDHAGAISAFERASELAPESAPVAYHFGSFLLDDAGDVNRALAMLQSAAKLDSASPEISGQIAWAHFLLKNYKEAITVCRHKILARESSYSDKFTAIAVALRAGVHGLSNEIDLERYDEAAELLEQCVEIVETCNLDTIVREPFDRITQIRGFCERLSRVSEDYIARKALEFETRLEDVQSNSQNSNTERKTGTIKSILPEKGFGFIKQGSTDYFFHYKDLSDKNAWDLLENGLACAFNPSTASPKGPRAELVEILF
ncbi:NB-ARC domain-containing protein [Rhodococcus sp. (in: high G+C Gram-positive bacteria)]|uniref:NB-ARC domain-containing protein n=1 Tax=Rhodococcus sp. TaxID=1831 RepID=UPI0033158E66